MCMSVCVCVCVCVCVWLCRVYRAERLFALNILTMRHISTLPCCHVCVCVCVCVCVHC